MSTVEFINIVFGAFVGATISNIIFVYISAWSRRRQRITRVQSAELLNDKWRNNKWVADEIKRLEEKQRAYWERRNQTGREDSDDEA